MAPEEFYVGYLDKAPTGIAKRIRHAVVAALGIAWLVAVAIAILQSSFAAKTFEFGSEREFVGWLRTTPVPRIVVAAPGNSPEGAVLMSYPLGRAGSKHGADLLVADHDGRFVRLRGWLIYREDDTMIDVVPGSITAVEEPETPSRAAPGADENTATELGVHTLVGQIVDSKCYFGVMNPGSGKVHRACAVRCISSGTPPVFAVRDAEGRARHLLIVGEDGRALNREILHVVAEPVEVTGRVSRIDQLLVLWIEPNQIRRL